MGSGSECGCRKEGGWEDGCVVSQCFEETDNFACAGCHFCEFFCRWLDMWIGGLEYGCGRGISVKIGEWGIDVEGRELRERQDGNSQ